MCIRDSQDVVLVADAVAPHLVGPIGRVVDRVEEGPAVGGESAAVVAALDDIGQVEAGAQVAETQFVDLVPGPIQGVCLLYTSRCV